MLSNRHRNIYIAIIILFLIKFSSTIFLPIRNTTEEVFHLILLPFSENERNRGGNFQISDVCYLIDSLRFTLVGLYLRKGYACYGCSEQTERVP